MDTPSYSRGKLPEQSCWKWHIKPNLEGIIQKDRGQYGYENHISPTELAKNLNQEEKEKKRADDKTKDIDDHRVCKGS
jgi:hypothetical protein